MTANEAAQMIKLIVCPLPSKRSYDSFDRALAAPNDLMVDTHVRVPKRVMTA